FEISSSKSFECDFYTEEFIFGVLIFELHYNYTIQQSKRMTKNVNRAKRDIIVSYNRYRMDLSTMLINKYREPRNQYYRKYIIAPIDGNESDGYEIYSMTDDFMKGYKFAYNLLGRKYDFIISYYDSNGHRFATVY